MLGKPAGRRRFAGDGDRRLRVRPQRAPARHAARTRRAAAGRRRDAGERRRELDSRSARRREGRRQKEFRRRGRREAVAGDSGGGEAEGDLDGRHRAAEPARLLRPPAEPEAVARHAARELEGRGRAARAGDDGAQGHLPPSVPDARVDRQLVRRGRRAGWQGHDLVADAVRLSDAQRLGAGARAAGRERPRDLHARLGLLRHQRRGHGVVRRGAAVAGGREAGAGAALAQGRDGVGELRRRVRDRSAGRRRRLRRDRRVGLRRLVADARRTARLRSPGQRDHRSAGRASSRRRSRRARPRRIRAARSTTTATPRRPT